MITYTTYINWLTQAYKYYFLDDADMSDSEWDYWSRMFFANRSELLKESFPIIHREEFTGASLFWLKRDEYPTEVLGILSEGSVRHYQQAIKESNYEPQRHTLQQSRPTSKATES